MVINNNWQKNNAVEEDKKAQGALTIALINISVYVWAQFTHPYPTPGETGKDNWE